MMNRHRRVFIVLILVVAAFACTRPDTSHAQGLGVVFQSPAPGATVNGGVAVQFESFGGADPGGDFIVQRHFVLSVDKVVVYEASPTLPYNHQEATYLWPSTQYADGPHVFEVRVTDELGATATATLSLTAANGSGAVTQNVVWTSPVNVAVSGNTITKNAGCSGCADAGAASQQAVGSGDGAAEFNVSSGMLGTVGLSVGNPGTGSSEIMFGLRFYPGYVEVREGGVYKVDWPLNPGAVHKVAVAGGAVKYFQDGALKYTSAKAPIYPLLLDASLNAVGGGVQNARITGGGGVNGAGTTNDATPPVVTITAPASGSTVSGNVAFTANATDDVGVASVQFKVDGVSVGSADTLTPYAVSWNSATVPNGTHTLTAVALDAVGNARTSAPVTVNVSNTGGQAGSQNVTWTGAVNVAVNGSTITKNAGCSGCADAGAVSQQMITSGNGAATFTVSSGAEMTVGLGTGNSGTGGNDVEFGLRFYPAGYVEVRESGVYKWDFALVAGATYKVAVENGVVKYYQNGALKYTSAKGPSLPLLLDTSLNSLGAAVQNAVVGP